MSVVVGLGNPGAVYAASRHNVGFMAVDAAADLLDVSMKKLLFRPIIMGSGELGGHGHALVKPLTFMNRSGTVVPYLLRRAQASPSQLIIICDNMDLEPGLIRIRRGGSAAGHNGIKSVIAHTGEAGFLRIYIGVGRPEEGISVIDHVLGIPEGSEAELLGEAAGRAAEAVRQLLAGTEEQRVMNEFNRKIGT